MLLRRIVVLLCAAHFLQSAPALLPVQPSPGPVDEIQSNDIPNYPGEEGDYFEGDIRLQRGLQDPYGILRLHRYPDASRAKRRVGHYQDDGSGGGVSPEEFTQPETWPDKRIPYKFLPDLPTNLKEHFRAAVKEWNRATCIQFTLKEENDTDYLLLTNTLGCSSYVARRGGEQAVSINDNCASVGHAMHELGHALGFWHEHSRPDRDGHITIFWSNLREEKMMQFGLLSQEVFNSVPDVGYDVQSIMHYGPYAFAAESNLRTIQVLEEPEGDCVLELGQRTELSYLDKVRANELYQCTDELEALRSQGGRVCPTTPPPTTSPPTTVKTILSGTRISIRFTENDVSAPGLQVAVSCDQHCLMDNCTMDFFSAEEICAIDQEFDIHLTEQRKNMKLKSSDTVVLRSRLRPGYWMDCSTGNCTISECSENEVNPNISTNISECNKHILVLYGINRNDGKTVRTTDEVVFRSPNNTRMFLNCLNKKCKMVEDTQCLTRTTESEMNKKKLCQRFSLHKE